MSGKKIYFTYRYVGTLNLSFFLICRTKPRMSKVPRKWELEDLPNYFISLEPCMWVLSPLFLSFFHTTLKYMNSSLLKVWYSPWWIYLFVASYYSVMWVNPLTGILHGQILICKAFKPNYSKKKVRYSPAMTIFLFHF